MLCKEDVFKLIAYETMKLKDIQNWAIPKNWPWDKNMQVLEEAVDRVFI